MTDEVFDAASAWADGLWLVEYFGRWSVAEKRGPLLFFQARTCTLRGYTRRHFPYAFGENLGLRRTRSGEWCIRGRRYRTKALAVRSAQRGHAGGQP